MTTSNLFLPGNLRYQPKEMVKYFGYDNLYRTVGEVEIASLQVLGEIGVIPPEEIALLNPEVVEAILSIPTTVIDKTEREVTKHDIQAWRVEARKCVDPRLGRWLHVILTSYDPLDTGRALQFVRAYKESLIPSLRELILVLADVVRNNSDVLQIGRTHGQSALPITAGFWLATILSRILFSTQEADRHCQQMVGKISGAVGAYNAQVGLGISERCGDTPFENRVLAKLGLKPARISTQILPPEYLTNFLHAIHLLSACFGQFGRDCRNLTRSEIAEISEPFSVTQAGSSTMAAKRNPISFEGLEGDWLRVKCAYHLVQEGLISDHQRDLVGSRGARDFPIILIIVQGQLDVLLRKDKQTNLPFLKRMQIDEESCRRNFQRAESIVLGEPLYIALQIAGFDGDAHGFVNHALTPVSLETGKTLVEVLEEMIQEDPGLEEIYLNIPPEIRYLLHHPEQYTGLASAKANEIADLAVAQMSG